MPLGSLPVNRPFELDNDAMVHFSPLDGLAASNF